MQRQLLLRWLMLLAVVTLVLSFQPVLAQDENLDADTMSETFYTEFNRILREDYDTWALARNAVLDSVAQRIAAQIGCSDERIEFSIQNEVKERGFETYPGDNSVRTTRIPLLPIVNLRPIEEIVAYYAGSIYGTNINQSGRFYREIGVGVSPCVARGGSTQQYSLFVILGARPNVIPVVIENGERNLEVESAPVTVTLSIHIENSRPRPEIFGNTSSVRLSNNEPISDDTPSQRYQQFIEWELDECGANTLYYELTDDADMVVTGSTSIELDCLD